MTKEPVDAANDADDCLEGDERTVVVPRQTRRILPSAVPVSLDAESSSSLQDVVKRRAYVKSISLCRDNVGNGHLSGLCS